MKIRLVTACCILLFAGAQGCSSLVHGTTQDLEITTIPQGARATVGTQTCVTPCKLTVKRASPTVQVEKGSFKKTVDLEKEFQWGATLFGNILWAEVGIIIDVATGGAWEIRPVNLQLSGSTPAAAAPTPAQAPSNGQAKAKEFIVQEYSGISKDLAKGSGEHLDTMMTLLGIKPEDRPSAISKIKANLDVYKDIPSFADSVIEIASSYQ